MPPGLAGSSLTLCKDLRENIGSCPKCRKTLTQAEDLLFRIRTGQEVRDFVAIREVLDQYMEDTATVAGPLDRGTAPIQTGFVDFDKLLGGLQRSDLIILAARPSYGKSTLALNIARNAARVGASMSLGWQVPLLL